MSGSVSTAKLSATENHIPLGTTVLRAKLIAASLTHGKAGKSTGKSVTAFCSRGNRVCS